MDTETDAGVKTLPNGGFNVPATVEPDPLAMFTVPESGSLLFPEGGRLDQ